MPKKTSTGSKKPANRSRKSTSKSKATGFAKGKGLRGSTKRRRKT